MITAALERARILRADGWRRMIFLREWEATGSLWTEDWEAGECSALREEFGVIDRLERAPRAADDADLMWQPQPNALGYRGIHRSMWAPELSRQSRDKYAARAR